MDHYPVFAVLVVGISVLTFMVQVSFCVIDDDLISFIYNRIPELKGQARGRQFAALVFLDQTEVDNLSEFQYHPHHNDGAPWVDNSVPTSPSSPWNYMVARPDRGYHAEEFLLDGLPGMWNNFINRGTHGPPAMIILFTRLYPCTSGTPGQTHNCAEKIREMLQQTPYNTVPHRVIVYNEEEDSPVPNIPFENYRFYSELGILPEGLPMSQCFSVSSLRSRRDANGRSTNDDIPDTCTTPVKIQTMQGCVLECLGNDIYTCVENNYIDVQKAYLMNNLIDKCLLNEKIYACFKNTFLTETGAACSSLDKQTIAARLVTCQQTCKLKPISVPRQSASEFDVNVSLLSAIEERANYNVPTSFGCKDTRRVGLLCTQLNKRYLTAGNSLCRDGHPCDYHGYEYYWCYTSYGSEWDYCCTGECGYHDNDYLWCQAGSEWQYCGKGGTITTGAKLSETSHPCLADHPCGLHHDKLTSGHYDYFWCYVDIDLNWDYCCSPEPLYNECTYNDGTDYKWCKIWYKKDTSSGTVWDWEPCYY